MIYRKTEEAIGQIFHGEPVILDEKQRALRLCRKMVTKDIALVSVEIASKSMMRSVRDRRINIMGQIASLGN